MNTRDNIPHDILEKDIAVSLLPDKDGRVRIPYGIRILGSRVFDCRKDIKYVDIPESVEIIRDSAFNACHNLIQISLPNSLRKIEDDAFARCFKLESISIPEGIEHISSGFCQHASNLKKVSVPSSVKKIDRIAFWYCHKLETIVLPPSVTEIYEDAFEGCTNLDIVAEEGSYAWEYAREHNMLPAPPSERKEKQSIDFAYENAESDAKDCSKKYAFISYSSRNQPSADAMHALLKKNGIGVWMAPGDIPPGSRYAQVINQAIKECSCVILMLSDASQNSQWVAREIERAVNYRKPIIPVQMEDMILNDEFELYIGTNHIVALQKIDETSNTVQQLLTSIAAHTGQITHSQAPSGQESYEGEDLNGDCIDADEYIGDADTQEHNNCSFRIVSCIVSIVIALGIFLVFKPHLLLFVDKHIYSITKFHRVVLNIVGYIWMPLGGYFVSSKLFRLVSSIRKQSLRYICSVSLTLAIVLAAYVLFSMAWGSILAVFLFIVVLTVLAGPFDKTSDR